ncbi:MAG TPA: hypothetical protein VGG08_01865 [Solirubrobacteraceae bacterium]|jgi:hypothetical protein
MDDFLLGVFQGELRTQCNFITFGGGMLNHIVPQLKEHQTANAIWFALQGILVSAANASKLLWGSKTTEDLDERQRLRESVGVDEQSPLYSRKLRNDFEHFDERIKTWADGNTQRIYVRRSIGPRDRLVVVGNEPIKDPFGIYDPETAKVTFWDREVALQPIITEADRIIKIIDQTR